MRFERPEKLDKALQLLPQEDWQLLSGGTDFFPQLGDGQAKGSVLDLSALAELGQISQSDDHWQIGAGVTWTQLIGAKLPPAFDGLKQAAAEIGSIQIQNRATLVGNICNASPAADGVPALLTLEASVQVESQKSRRTVPLQKFILGNRQIDLGPDELVTTILVPKSATLGTASFLKLGGRKNMIISIASAAARLVRNDNGEITSAAIAVGACSLVSKRLAELEADLVGKTAADVVGILKQNHFATLSPISDIRASKDYRLSAARELVSRTISNALERS